MKLNFLDNYSYCSCSMFKSNIGSRAFLAPRCNQDIQQLFYFHPFQCICATLEILAFKQLLKRLIPSVHFNSHLFGAVGNSSEIFLSPYLLHFTIDNLCMSYSQETTNKEFVTAVVVEYTNNKLYMGVLEEDELTYCKSHIGKLNENFKMCKVNTNSLVLNKKR